MPALHPIDAFINARLAEKGLTPNPPAKLRTLIRRASFDLLGLPPTFEEVTEFENDPRPDAWERLLDRLLARPEYGERWARHWLDVVRFAQSNGYERDGEKPLAWRYRDYVVRAFNADKPYDQFVREHLAGDELTPFSPEAVIATGYARLGVLDDEPDDQQMAVFDELDDVLSTTGAAFLGLTLGCARCHDHKFDPIPHADYYRLLAFFRGVLPTQHLTELAKSTAHVPLAPPEEVAVWRTQQAAKIKSLEAEVAAARTDAEKKPLQTRLEAAKSEAPPFEHALAMRERGAKPEPTFVLKRGSARSPGEEVQPAFLSALSPHPSGTGALAGEGTADATVRRHAVGTSSKTPGEGARWTTTGEGAGATWARGATQGEENANSSGRRLLLANWIASAENPLTARVIVNRVWHHHFGRGLVKTTGDFGHAGSGPTHPELLDWLASEFIARGWSLKQLHKLIMTSEAYRRSSAVDVAAASVSNGGSVVQRPENGKTGKRENETIPSSRFPVFSSSAVAASAYANPGGKNPADEDAANDWLWRQNLHRLEAEALRDSILAISGRLNPTPGGRGFFPHLSGEVLAGGSRPGTDWEVSTAAEQSRRSLYAYVRRTSPVPFLETLDYANYYSPLTERPVTTVAPQALLLLNDNFMREQAVAFAAKLRGESAASADSRSAAAGENGKTGKRENGTFDDQSASPHVPVFPSSRFQSVQLAEARTPTDTHLLTRAYQLALARNPTSHELAVSRDFLDRQRAQFAALRSRLDFHVEVPATMNVSYFTQLQPGDFFAAPAGWTAFRGAWPDSYEGNRIMQRGNGPFALWTGERFTNASITARLLLHTACESAGLLFRANTDGDKLRGYELLFDPRKQRLALRRHATNIVTLAEADAAVPTGASVPVKVEVHGPSVQVWLGGGAAPVLTCTDSALLVALDGRDRPRSALGSVAGSGALGFRAWGAALSVDELRLRIGDRDLALAPPDDETDPDRRALEAFCLLLLNLNEVVYVE